MHTKFIRLPLQFFAEGGEQPSGEEHQGGEGTEPAVPTFDDVLKDKTYQSEFDRRIAKAQETAVAREREKWEAQAQLEKEEAAKLAKMNADERAKHEREKQEKALAEREAAVTKRELTAEAISQLGEKGLPIILADCLDFTSAETCKKSIEKVEQAFNSAVEKAVNDTLRGVPPKAGAVIGTTTVPNKTLI